jgi:formylglycine-generating enzyme required for sulfatase activity
MEGEGMAADALTSSVHTNAIGMRFARIEPGRFRMGAEGGDLDELPVHDVGVSRPFSLGVVPVTNLQYEEFDPGHRSVRGKQSFSFEDDEAALFVSWADAVAFCRWLAGKEGLPYRLPTEAEWEYACRAGSSGDFAFGDVLPPTCLRNQTNSWYPDPDNPKDRVDVPLVVGLSPANSWGLRDMHGLVEEWCADWYGSYPAAEQADPVGPQDGEYKVTRGGSHSTELRYLRSAARSAALPEERSWYIGFRVAIGGSPATKPLPVPGPEPHARGVGPALPAGHAVERSAPGPFFAEPRRFVRLTPDSRGPFYHHNHVPALTECPNGDLLSIWYTCETEKGRELRIVASRLRHGRERWDDASYFWVPPDRNATGSALLCDDDGTIYHWNGMSAAGTWGNLVLVQRTSKDSGATWSRARIVQPEHGLRHMPIASPIRHSSGALVLPCDAVTIGQGGTALQVSHDRGETWSDTGGTVAGIHAPIVELGDGRILALGRGDNIGGRMPMSVSANLGRTWQYSASEFDPIGGGQRAILVRLREGAIFFASFARTLVFTDAEGRERVGRGLFGALSYDDGESWPVKKLITDGGLARRLDGGAWTGQFTMGPDLAEPKGYLTAIQARDGLIHLISSAQHYVFNAKWLETPPPAVA